MLTFFFYGERYTAKFHESNNYARFEVFTAKFQIEVFWVVKPCRDVIG
jgi:hypothetical protein